MKTKFLYLFVAFFMLSSTSVFAQNNNEETIYRGDVNADGVVDAADIVAVINVMKNAGGVEGSVSALKLSVTKKTFGLNGGTVSITATPTHNMSVEPTVNWSTTDGTLSAKTGNTVTFTAPKNTTSSNVTYTITAECGGKTATCTVTVVTTDAPPVQYYWYAGWTEPNESNIEDCINETYPNESGSTDMNTAGKSRNTIEGEIMDYTTNTLYNSSAKTNYYVVVPNGQSVYDSDGTDLVKDPYLFGGKPYSEFTNHKVYKTTTTSRNINAIIIKK